jgi:hypothetical protein
MKRWVSVLVLAIVLACVPESQGQVRTGKNGPMAKLTHSLVALHNRYAAHLAQLNATPFRSGNPLITVIDDHVVIDAVASGDVNVLKADLVSLGMQQAVAFGRIVSGQLPVSALPAAAGMARLRFAQPAAAATNIGSVTSQGDQAMQSNVARTTYAMNGSGITVGALSDSFNCLGGAAADIASGDLSPVSVIQEHSSCDGATDEGRALLQIVHDVAPGASLTFASAFNGLASFATNIQSLASSGAKVIVDDVLYFAEPMFQDGIVAQAVNNIVTAGVAYFSSAGNQARQSYESAFRAGGVFAQDAIPSAPGTPPFFGGTAHDFDPGGSTDVFQRITLPAGAGFIMSFQWDSPAFSVSGAPGSPNDLDVYVLNADASQVVAGANRDNLGNDPIEVFSFTNTTSATADFNIMIVNFAGPNPGLIKYVLFNSGGTIQEFATNSGTLYGHANGTGAEAVGAAAYFSTPAFGVSPPVLNPFSSSGTTPILFDQAGNRLTTPELRAKPEIVAPDGGDTTFFGSDTDGNGFPNFFGTSASAPHAAAVAALILQARPTLTPARIYASLENTAIDMGAAGFDNNSGFGLIQADAALVAALLSTGEYLEGQAQYADLNGDGKADVIYQGSDNTFWDLLSTGTGFTSPTLWVDHGGSFLEGQAQYADLNGDGKADLIFQGVDNIFWVSLSTGTGFTGPVWWIQHGGPFIVGQAQYADLNGDGKADLIFQGVDNIFWVSLSTGTGFTGPVWWIQHGGPFIVGQAKYVDLNGDGNADLIFQGVDNNFWVNLSTGNDFTAPQLWLRF